MPFLSEDYLDQRAKCLLFVDEQIQLAKINRKKMAFCVGVSLLLSILLGICLKSTRLQEFRIINTVAAAVNIVMATFNGYYWSLWNSRLRKFMRLKKALADMDGARNISQFSALSDQVFAAFDELKTK